MVTTITTAKPTTIYGSNNNNNNGNNNDICSDNIVCSTPRGRGRQSNRSIRSPSPMPTRARSPKRVRHVRLSPNGRAAAQEIRYHEKRSPTIVADLVDHTGVDNIENYNNNAIENYNNNNEEEEEEEEEELPSKQLFK